MFTTLLFFFPQLGLASVVPQTAALTSTVTITPTIGGYSALNTALSGTPRLTTTEGGYSGG